MDDEIGKALAQLESHGLSKNTIVVYNSDHGGVLPRSKRFLFNSGTHCPLIIRIPDQFAHLRPGKRGTKVDRLVSFIDMTKTWLTICKAETPEYLQGKTFLGPDSEAREYHVSYRGRMDERCDNVRAIRDRKFLYIRNYMPYAPWGQHLGFLWRMRATQAWESYHRNGNTNAVTGRFFGTKPMEELYDTTVDPDNVNNLAEDPEYASELKRLSAALDDWQQKHFDAGLLPESEIVKRSEDAGKTIHEFVRDTELCNVEAYQRAASAALSGEVSNLPQLLRDLQSPDGGIRYWAVVGCFRLPADAELDLAAIRDLLSDESHHVRAMAAWVLYQRGDKAAAQKCWNDLLANSSYASLKVLNIIDWIGDGTEPYAQSIKACQFDHSGYVARMKEYFGY
jgi:hypothetical protein